MMTHRNLGGKWAEAEEGAVKGRSDGNHGTRLDISIQKLHWQPGCTECSPIISIHQQSWEGENQRKGMYEKKNGFDIQADRLSKAISSQPFQKTWPPAVWWIMDPQLGYWGVGPKKKSMGNQSSWKEGVIWTVKQINSWWFWCYQPKNVSNLIQPRGMSLEIAPQWQQLALEIAMVKKKCWLAY